MNTNTQHLKNLTIIGREFEQFAGMRARALAESFHDEDPIDCLTHMEEVCYDTLGVALTEEGLLGGGQSLEDICGACYDLRMQYGHGVWISSALEHYLGQVKGLDNEAVITTRARLLEASDNRFASVKADYDHRRDLRHVHYCLKEMDRMASEIQGLKASIERVVAGWAPDAQSYAA